MLGIKIKIISIINFFKYFPIYIAHPDVISVHELEFLSLLKFLKQLSLFFHELLV